MEINIFDIISMLPHRYPFLLIDKVLEVIPGKSVTAIKNVTVNEPYFTGHFPDQPIMPGVAILEALAQASGILVYKTANLQPGHNFIFYYAGIDNARFKRIVIPGDQLKLHSELIKAKKEIWKMQVTATVDDHLACTAEILVAQKENTRD